MRPLLLTAVVMVAFPNVAAATSNIGQALFEWFMIWCGIPAIALGALGAASTKIGYERSLLALAGVTLIVATVMGSWQAFVMLLLYAAILHVLSYKLAQFVRWLFRADDSSPYKKHIADAQQGVPADRPRPPGSAGG